MKLIMRNFAILALVIGVIALLVAVQPALADNLYGSIRGTVIDPSGAAMAGAIITATNTDTGIVRRETTNQTGGFVFQQLAIGNYKVSVSSPNFKTYQAAGIHLDLDQVYSLNVKLEVGAVSEAVQVEANPVQVQQTDMQLGTTIEGQQLVDLPLNGRNWTQLQQLQPGIIGTSDRFGGANGAYSGNGAGTQQNSFMINGVDSNDSSLNTALVVPSPDAIGEFRLVANTLNPEYGRNSGTVINATIKSGTNAFHGSGFEFYRDTFLDARNYFEYGCTDPFGNLKSDCRSPFHQNEYGGTVGGPILKNKTFFFFSYQGYKQRVPQSPANTVQVYTPAMFNNGDFTSRAFTGNTDLNPVPMFGDSASPCPVAGGAQCPALSQPYSALFSTGTVPTQDFNPLSVKLVNQFVPLANSGQVVVSPTTTAHDHELLGRIDHHLTNNDQLWFYGLWETHPSQDTLPFTGTTLPGLPEAALRHTHQYSISWTHTFSPTTLNELRLGYTRFNFSAVTPVNPINPTTYGFTGITPQNPKVASLPVMTTPLFTLGFSANGPQPRIQNVYQLNDNFSKVRGRHTIKAGFTVDRPSIDNPFYNNNGGNFSFAGAGGFSTGDGAVDFLLGIPDSYNQGSGSVVHAKAHEIYAYVQDQWQIRSNLTLTFGTGYDIETPWVNNYANGLIMGAWRPGQQSTVFPTAPAGFVYPGDKGMTKYGGAQVRYDLFAPRLGFAWSPDPARKWSVHGGIGLYYNRSEEELSLQTLTNAPFAITSNGAGSACGSVGFATPFSDATGKCSTAIPFPFTPPSPGDKNIDFSQFEPIGFGFTGVDPRVTAPRSTNFNLTIERQLDKATILSLAYVGNRGRHEEGAFDGNLAGQAPGVNPFTATYIAPNAPAGSTALCTRGSRMLVDYPGTTIPVCPQTSATENADLTWSLGAPVAGATPYNLALYGHPGIELTEFNSRYDSLQLTVNRRFSRGLQVLAAYTWSRYFDQTSSLESNAFNFPGINPFCPQCMWAPSGNDAPQRFVVSYTYTLPFYSLTHKWRKLTDDWNLAGIYTLQHGTPVGVFDFRNYSTTCDNSAGFFACPGQAMQVGKVQFANPRTPVVECGSTPPVADNYWIASGSLGCNAPPAAFAVPASGTLGTASRNPFYGPGINYGDMAIEKRIHIDEGRYIELRFETYNTFNHANFANPTDNGFNSEDVQSLFGVFGKIYSTKTITTNGEGRAVQIGAKFYF